jgi:hypothetical protein
VDGKEVLSNAQAEAFYASADLETCSPWRRLPVTIPPCPGRRSLTSALKKQRSPIVIIPGLGEVSSQRAV